MPLKGVGFSSLGVLVACVGVADYNYYTVAKLDCKPVIVEVKVLISLLSCDTYTSRADKLDYNVETVLSNVPMCEVREVNYDLKNSPASLPK